MRTGQALVKLGSMQDFKKALVRNGQFHEDNCIQVFTSSMHEYQRHSSSSSQQHSSRAPTSSTCSSSSGNKKVLLPTPPPGEEDNGESSAHSPIPLVASDDGFYIKIYGLPPPSEFDDDQVREMFNNVRFMGDIVTSHAQFPTSGHNQTAIVKAKRLCRVETKMDVDRALTRW